MFSAPCLVFVDETKIEANANRYTFVWGKAIATQKQKIKNQLGPLWSYAQNVYNTELQEPETPDFTEISAEKVEETIRQINQKLSTIIWNDTNKKPGIYF